MCVTNVDEKIVLLLKVHINGFILIAHNKV
jgi:hypothetical protein